MSLEITSIVALGTFILGFTLGRLTAGSRRPSGYFTEPTQPLKPLSEDVTDEIKKLAKADKKIEAIKLYRESTGCGLKEAKDAVEQLESA